MDLDEEQLQEFVARGQAAQEAVDRLIQSWQLDQGYLESVCPTCGVTDRRLVYDIGSGPEISCSNCEWCWGAVGQLLKPLTLRDVADNMTPEVREISGIDKYLPPS